MLCTTLVKAESAEQTACLKHVSTSWSAAAQAAARTDCEFYAANLVTGGDAWLKYADEHVATGFAKGKTELRAGITGMYSRPEFKLEWYPETAADHGSFVVTTGKSTRSWRLPDGTMRVIHSHYLTVWQRQEDGRYLFTYDVGEDDPKL